MTNEQAARIDQVLSHRVSVEDSLAEISRDLADLHARLARVLGTEVGFWSPSLPVAVDRDVYDRMTGSEYRNDKQGYMVKHPQPGLAIYCHNLADHDLRAENAPGESASTTNYAGCTYHNFYRIGSGDPRATRSVGVRPDGSAFVQ